MKLRTTALHNAASWLKSPLVQTLAMFGASGAAFALANIIWARALSPATYAVVALCVALWNLSLRFAPFGADLEVNRDQGIITRSRIRRVTATSAIAGAASAAIAGFGYAVPSTASIALGVAVTAGGVIAYAAATLQARRRYLPSLTLLHSSNYVALAVAIATAVAVVTDVRWIIGAIALGTILVLLLESLTLDSLTPSADGPVNEDSRRRLLSLIAITGSAELLTQLDRLATPLLLSLEDLARLSVLLALVGPPFRLLEMAVAYSLLPELKSAGGLRGMKKAMRHTILVAGVISAIAAVILLWILAPLSHWLFGDQFALPTTLIIVVLAAGLVRVIHGVAGAAAMALVPEARLPRLALLGIASALTGIAGTVVGSRWGLQGIICGSMTGWVFRTAGCAYLVREALRTGHDRR